MARIHFTSQSQRLISGSSLPSTRTGYGTADIGASFSGRGRYLLGPGAYLSTTMPLANGVASSSPKVAWAPTSRCSPRPDDDRRHREVELVQEPMLEQCLVELTGAELEDVAAG